MTVKGVLVAGCGKIGLPLARSLTDNFEVWGLRRSQMENEAGVRFLSADLTKPEGLHEVLPEEIHYVVYCLTPEARSEACYTACYVDGLTNLLQALPNPKALERVLFVSSTAVYHQQDGSWVDEHSAAHPERFNGRVMLQAEAVAESLGFAVTVIRFSGIYGGGRNQLVARVKAGSVGLTTAPHFSNRIHQDDCVGFLRHLLVQASSQTLQRLYIATDSMPVLYNDLLGYLAQRLEVTLESASGSEGLTRSGSKRCSNRRMLSTGYQLKYPSYREGYAEILARH